MPLNINVPLVEHLSAAVDAAREHVIQQREQGEDALAAHEIQMLTDCKLVIAHFDEQFSLLQYRQETLSLADYLAEKDDIAAELKQQLSTFVSNLRGSWSVLGMQIPTIGEYDLRHALQQQIEHVYFLFAHEPELVASLETEQVLRRQAELELQASQNQIAAMTEERDHQRNQIANLTAEKAEKQAAIDNLHLQFSLIRMKNMQLESSVATLQEQMQALQTAMVRLPVETPPPRSVGLFAS